MTTLEKAVETYGKDMQLTVAVEEFSELIKEICKNKRGRDNRDNIIEEMGDCYIMLQQLEIIFGISSGEIIDVIDEKTVRLEKRLAEEQKDCGNCGNRKSAFCLTCLMSYDKATNTRSVPSNWKRIEKREDTE